MISSEVERTLVKSPPELWTELSNPEVLARHLGELGEIRITRVEPEHAVDWEAGGTTSGTVRIKPSGWGTKVTLTATKEIAAPERPTACGPEADANEPEAVADKPETVTIEAEPTGVDATAELESEPDPVPVPTGPRVGFFRRLFGGRRKNQTQPPETVEPGLERRNALAAVSAALAPETLAVDPFCAPRVAEAAGADESATDASDIDAPEPDVDISANPDISAELKAAEEIAAEEVTAVLTSVLDRLGAAHHRPFSRA